MKKQLLTVISAVLLGSTTIQSQCISTSPYGSATISSCPTGSTSITGCNYKGEYSELTFSITGVFSFNAIGGTTQNYLTLTDAANTPIAFGNAPLQATIAATGIYRLHLTDPSCGIENVCHTTSYECALPVCTGMPASGTLSGSSFTICPSSSATFSVSGATLGSSITYQWQQSSNVGGPFTNVTSGTGGTTIAYTTGSLTATTFYKMITTCTASAMSATTDVVSVYPTNPLNLCYCQSNLGGSGCSGDNITNVTFISTGLNNTSACNTTIDGTYTQFTPGAGTTATLTTGSSYSISINTTADNIESVWIDYNQNGIFENSEHSQICTTSTPNTATGYNLTIPVSATQGQTGMRVRSRATGNPNGPTDACTNFGSGETEDYIITIVAGTNCTGAPSAGTIPSSLGVCANNNVTITSAGSTSSVGITYQWQQSTNFGGPFTNVTAGNGATTTAYTTTSLTAGMYYQMVVTCTASAISATTAVTSVSINPANQCYCLTSYNFGCAGDQVDTVIIGSLANYTSGCPSTPYNTFFNALPIPNYNAGTNVNATFVCGNGGNHWMNVWIDFNNDGAFATSEAILTNLNVPNTVPVSTVIAIPAGATLGNHRMRVICYYGSMPTAPPDACGPFSYGETEDYIVNINLPTNLKNVELNTGSLTIYPNPANEMVSIFTESNTSNSKIEIYNTVGDLVTETVFNGNKITVNTDNFSAGIYTIKLVSGANSISKKLVIYK